MEENRLNNFYYKASWWSWAVRVGSGQRSLRCAASCRWKFNECGVAAGLWARGMSWLCAWMISCVVCRERCRGSWIIGFPATALYGG